MKLKDIFSSLFSNADIDVVATALCELFFKHVSLSQAQKPALVDRAYKYVLAQAKGEKRLGQWGGAATARLANKFGWMLVEKGYPKDAAIKLARKLAVDLAAAKRSAP